MVTANVTDAEALPNLEAHRPMILVRSALVGIASVVPLPGLGEMLAKALSRGLIYHVVQLSFVDIEEEAVETLLAPSPKEQRRGLLTVLGGLGSLLRKRRGMRRMFAGLAVLHGLSEGSRVFHLATLLDHYCSHHHNGATIREADAQKLRQAFDTSTRTAQRELGSSLMSEVVSQSLLLTQSLGKWSWALVSRKELGPIHPSLHEVAHGFRTWLADLSVRHYLGRVTDIFDKKWSGAESPQVKP